MQHAPQCLPDNAHDCHRWELGVHLRGTRMTHWRDNLLRLVLLVSFLMTQLFCACSAHAAPRASAALVAASQDRESNSTHSCCDGKTDKKRSDHAPGETHDPTCPHCSGGAKSVNVADRASEVAPPIAIPLVWLNAVHTVLHVEPRSAEPSRLLTRWLADQPPPPDLLRVKCTLQI